MANEKEAQRRAEQDALRNLRYDEKLDRNIARAGRKGDNKTVASLLAIKSAIKGGAMKAPGGIANYEDRQERVKDAVIKGADYRFKMGQIGNAGDDGGIGNAGEGRIPNAENGSRIPNAEDGRALTESKLDADPAPKLSPSAPSITPKLDAANNTPRLDSGGTATPRIDYVDPTPRINSTRDPETIGETFAQTEARKREQGAASGAYGKPAAPNARQQFARDLDNSEAIASGDPAARERAYQRGAGLDLTREQIQKKMGWETDTEAAAKKYKKEYGKSDKAVKGAVDRLDKIEWSTNGQPSLQSDLSPAMIAKIRENMKKVSPEDKKAAASDSAKKRTEREEKIATNNYSGQAKALIPGAKAELQGVIDQRESYMDRRGEETLNFFRNEKKSYNVKDFDNLSDMQKDAYWHKADRIFGESYKAPEKGSDFRKQTEELKKRRGQIKPILERLNAPNEKPLLR